jgi:hypothetical protein
MAKERALVGPRVVVYAGTRGKGVQAPSLPLVRSTTSRGGAPEVWLLGQKLLGPQA